MNGGWTASLCETIISAASVLGWAGTLFENCMTSTVARDTVLPVGSISGRAASEFLDGLNATRPRNAGPQHKCGQNGNAGFYFKAHFGLAF